MQWNPDKVCFREDYHNYKGWHSILCLMFVNSFSMFVDGEVGHPGRQSDSALSEHNWMFHQIHNNVEGWLGEGGLMIGDLFPMPAQTVNTFSILRSPPLVSTSNRRLGGGRIDGIS